MTRRCFSFPAIFFLWFRPSSYQNQILWLARKFEHVKVYQTTSSNPLKVQRKPGHFLMEVPPTHLGKTVTVNC